MPFSRNKKKEAAKPAKSSSQMSFSKKLKKFRNARLSKDNKNKVKAIVVKITYHEDGEKSSMEEDDDLDDVDTERGGSISESWWKVRRFRRHDAYDFLAADDRRIHPALPTSSPRYIVLVFWKEYEDGRQNGNASHLLTGYRLIPNPTQLTLHAMASKQFEKAVSADCL